MAIVVATWKAACRHVPRPPCSTPALPPPPLAVAGDDMCEAALLLFAYLEASACGVSRPQVVVILKGGEDLFHVVLGKESRRKMARRFVLS